MVKWIVTATADYGVSYHSEVVEAPTYTMAYLAYTLKHPNEFIDEVKRDERREKDLANC